MPRVYIRGLVKIANGVRQRLKSGIAVEEEEIFKKSLQDTLSQVEDICLRYRITPNELPAPTRNAYTYLRDLDLQNLPRPRRRKALDQPADPALLASFQRVNREYFSGLMTPPKLCWSQRLTWREFGTYRMETDVVTISRTLASASVPDFVRDFVMYHELLHRQMGANRIKGRLRSHTPDFRLAEMRYRNYTEAQNYLKQLAADHSTRKKSASIRRFKR